MTRKDIKPVRQISTIALVGLWGIWLCVLWSSAIVPMRIYRLLSYWTFRELTLLLLPPLACWLLVEAIGTKANRGKKSWPSWLIAIFVTASLAAVNLRIYNLSTPNPLSP